MSKCWVLNVEILVLQVKFGYSDQNFQLKGKKNVKILVLQVKFSYSGQNFQLKGKKSQNIGFKVNNLLKSLTFSAIFRKNVKILVLKSNFFSLKINNVKILVLRSIFRLKVKLFQLFSEKMSKFWFLSQTFSV